MVSKHIKDLLFNCDELIINDLGTLHAAYASADAHPASHVFAPPHKNITFSQNPKISNGVLEEYIAQTENVSLQDAEGQVKQFVSSVKIDLGIHKKYPMAQLGSFVLQYEDQLEFKSETELNYLNDAFGLPQIFGKIVERTDEEIKAESAALTALATSKTGTKNGAKMPNNLNANNTGTVATANGGKKPSEIDKENKKTNWGIIGAISSLGIISAIALYVLVIDPSKNPFRTILKNDQLAQKDKDKAAESKAEEKKEEVKPVEDKKEEEKKEEVKPTEDKKEENKPTENKVEEVKVAPPVETNTNSEIVDSKQGRSYVIIGGFGVQGNAYNVLNKLKAQGENNVRIIAPYGNSKLFRVAIRNFASDADAKAALAEIKNKYAEYQTAFVLAY